MNHDIQEITVKYSNITPPSRGVHSSQEAYKVFMESWNQDTIELQEEFKVMLLNRASKLLGIFSLSKGGISETVADIRLLFATAIKSAATSIILGHNHPSGNLEPSAADTMLTNKIRRAGEILDIKVLDHLIITKEGYYSFSDEGN